METEYDPLGDGISKLKYIDHMGDDLRVTNAARSSFGKWNDSWGPRDEKVMGILTDGTVTHWSPFAHVMLTAMVKAPISMQRPWFKHVIGFAHNSESSRYVELKEEFYIPTDVRKQSKERKQGSGGCFGSGAKRALQYKIRSAYADAYASYTDLINNGVAKEIARDVLPLGTYTTWVTTGSLAAWHRLVYQRTHEGAQWEISRYATAVGEMCRELFPVAWAALMREGHSEDLHS